MRVAAPLEVVISKEYAEALTDAKQRAIALGSLGSAFGSEHLSSGTSQYTADLPDLCLRTPAAELVAFDVFIHNPDRRRTNPNLFVSRGDLLAFDHGDAYCVLLPILGAPDPVRDALEKSVEEHACRGWLRNRTNFFARTLQRGPNAANRSGFRRNRRGHASGVDERPREGENEAMSSRS